MANNPTPGKLAPSPAPAEDPETSFIESIAPAAIASQKQFRVPASVTIAQAILESGWGKSRLAREFNNFFGIKGRPGHDYGEMVTTEFTGVRTEVEMAMFEKFASPTACFWAHGMLLGALPRYKPAMKHCDDPFQFAISLAECGYSTDPNYAQKLATLITEHRLTQFDADSAPADENETGRQR